MVEDLVEWFLDNKNLHSALAQRKASSEDSEELGRARAKVPQLQNRSHHSNLLSIKGIAYDHHINVEHQGMKLNVRAPKAGPLDPKKHLAPSWETTRKPDEEESQQNVVKNVPRGMWCGMHVPDVLKELRDGTAILTSAREGRKPQR